MLTFLSKIHPVCHNIANGKEPGSDSKTTDMLKSCVLGRKVICVRCINCSYNSMDNMAKGIRLLDKKAIFLYRKKFIQVRAFESNIPLI